MSLLISKALFLLPWVAPGSKVSAVAKAAFVCWVWIVMRCSSTSTVSAWPLGILTDNLLGSATANRQRTTLPARIQQDVGEHREIYEFPHDVDGNYFIDTCLSRFPGPGISMELQRQYCEHHADDIFRQWHGNYYFPGLHLSNDRKNHTADYLASRGTVLALLADRMNYRHYLEIGTDLNDIFAPAQEMFDVAVGVDPAQGGTLRMTSDEYFAQNMNGSLAKQTFDLVFVDGLHEANQVYSDVMNALLVLNEGGTIVMHDCNPHGLLDRRAVYPRIPDDAAWNGDTWKAVVALRLLHPSDIDVIVVDIDHGVGVVRRRPNTHPFPQEWTERLLANATELESSNIEDVGFVRRPEYVKSVIALLTNEHFHLFRTQLLPLCSVDEMLDWLN
jgi:predicted O-methyltransferase YrrM